MRRKAPAILAAALAAAALSTAGAAQGATVRPQSASCYNWGYNYSINSSQIQVTATWLCGGTAPQTWMILQRLTSYGTWQYITDSNSPYPHNGITYNCVGTTPNTYQVGPIFAPGGGSNSFYQFTDNCG